MKYTLYKIELDGETLYKNGYDEQDIESYIEEAYEDQKIILIRKASLAETLEAAAAYD